jgi:hypothetical protein
MEERFGLADRIKTMANSLVKAGKHAFARARYDRLLRMLESTRDYETQVCKLVSLVSHASLAIHRHICRYQSVLKGHTRACTTSNAL